MNIKSCQQTRGKSHFLGYIRVKHTNTHMLCTVMLLLCGQRWHLLVDQPAFWSWWYLQYNTRPPFQKPLIKWQTALLSQPEHALPASPLNQHNQPIKHIASHYAKKKTSATFVANSNNNVFFHMQKIVFIAHNLSRKLQSHAKPLTQPVSSHN